eukprot:445786-Pelagomonas_calceolata.AAC.1
MLNVDIRPDLCSRKKPSTDRGCPSVASLKAKASKLKHESAWVSRESTCASNKGSDQQVRMSMNVLTLESTGRKPEHLTLLLGGTVLLNAFHSLRFLTIWEGQVLTRREHAAHPFLQPHFLIIRLGQSDEGCEGVTQHVPPSPKMYLSDAPYTLSLRHYHAQSCSWPCA